MERFANNPVTTLAEDLDGSETGVDVTSAASFPTGGNFRILVDSEIMLVTGVSSNTFTVTRGAEGTSATTHANGAEVRKILTKGAMDALWGDAFTFRAGVTTPVNGDFAWTNQGPSTITVQDNGGLHLLAVADATASLRMRRKAAPSTPYVITAYVLPFLYPADFNTCGLMMRESGTGKIETLYFTHSTVLYIASEKWTDETTFSANRVAAVVANQPGPIRWLRMEDNGTTIFLRYSSDGVNYRLLTSFLRGSFFTTGPDQVGFLASSGSASFDAGITVMSWKEE